jgi:hypothetical protein
VVAESLNPAIRKLERVLPLGTPVLIRP